MQIDGHHAGTYVTARAAGFSHEEAEIVAYSAQYVDDATNGGAIYFHDSEYMYSRIASAHRMLDYNNLVELANHLVWLPFHFLPGNDGLPAGEDPSGGEAAKLICRPDSQVARDMLRASLADRDSSRSLHRLGITMHVYADTFAHQGFIGAMHEANRVQNLRSDTPGADQRLRDSTLRMMKKAIWGNLKAVALVIGKSVQLMLQERKWPINYWLDFLKSEPLGHGSAKSYPDQPYLTWQYEAYDGLTIKRNNPEIYSQAFDMMTRAMRAWRMRDEKMELEKHEGINDKDRAVIDGLIRALDDPNGKRRHERWLEAIAAGRFSFGAAQLSYVHKGENSWKYSALGTKRYRDTGIERYPYTEDFLESDWKLFHDAVQAHRSDIVHEILPRYGICAA